MAKKKTKKKQFNVAVVGVTGVVGESMLECLAKRRFPVDELRIMASHRSAGKKIKWRNRKLTVIEASTDAFEGIDIALMAVESDQSKVFSPAAASASTPTFPRGVLHGPEPVSENSGPSPVWFGPSTMNVPASRSEAMARAAVLPEYT